MKNKRVKTRGLLCATLFFTMLTLSLYGCSKAGQGQKTEPDVNPDDAAITEAESGGKPKEEQGVELRESKAAALPESFSETIGNVTFNMDIIVNADLTENPIVTAKA